MSLVFTPPPRRILVRGVNWLGDAVMTTPALLRLREKFPAAYIAMLVPEKLQALWHHHPAVNEVITFAKGEGLLALRRKLRARPEPFDLALVLPNSPRSALDVFCAGIPQRVGYSRPWRNFFLTRIVPARREAVKMHKRTDAEIQALLAAAPGTLPAPFKPAASAHQTHEYLYLVAALGASPEPLAPLLAVPPEEIADARAKFGIAAAGGLILGLNPGAEYGPAKRWPAEKFITAAQTIQQRTACRWIVFGGPADRELAGRIAAGIGSGEGTLPPINVAGQTSLRELMALLKCCRVLLTNDTGPMHVAAALGTPVVVPFGSTSPELTGPGLPGDPRHRLIKTEAPCAPCFRRECPVDFRCLNGLPVDAVVSAVLAAAFENK